jgi:hypothetical protein
MALFGILNTIAFSHKKEFTEIIREHVVLESDLKFADCGYFHFIHAFKFKRVNSGSFIIGFIGCPEMLGKNFLIKGDSYIVDITNDMKKRLKDAEVINIYKEENLPTYFVTRIIKEK